MKRSRTSFGSVVSGRRKEKGWSLRELAKRVKKEDSGSVTPQYLNDIEHDRRSPSDFVLAQLAQALDLDADSLRLLAGGQPEYVRVYLEEQPERADQIAKVFRKTWESAVRRIGEPSHSGKKLPR